MHRKHQDPVAQPGCVWETREYRRRAATAPSRFARSRQRRSKRSRQRSRSSATSGNPSGQTPSGKRVEDAAEPRRDCGRRRAAARSSVAAGPTTCAGLARTSSRRRAASRPGSRRGPALTCCVQARAQLWPLQQRQPWRPADHLLERAERPVGQPRSVCRSGGRSLGRLGHRSARFTPQQPAVLAAAATSTG